MKTMTNLMKIEQNLTMTSREIAELAGKEHFHIMRDLRALKEQLTDLFGGSIQNWIHPQNGQKYEEFVLDKDTCLTLLLGYDAVARMKVIKRWQELESQVAKPLTAAEMFLQSAQTMLMIEQRTALIEKQQQEVKQNVAIQATKLLKVESAISEVKETNLLTSCPTAAESITGIRLRMNEEYGLSASVVDAVMRQSLYAPKPVGMVRNQHESSGGSTYAVYWKKDISNVFKMFVGECKQLMNSVWYKHPFIKSKFKMNK